MAFPSACPRLRPAVERPTYYRGTQTAGIALNHQLGRPSRSLACYTA